MRGACPDVIPSDMRFLRFAALVVFTVASAFGADHSDYLPLKEGCEWTMDVVIVSPQGEKSTATGRRKVGAAEERSGNTYYRTRTWIEGGPFQRDHVKLTRKDDAGFYSLDPKDPTAKEQTELLLPFEIGKSWQRNRGRTTTVVGMESVTINGMTYENCYHMRTTSRDDSYTEDYWEAPKIGSVKSEIVYGNGGKITLKI